MSGYRRRVAEIERRLGRRRLVFFGTRGTDARPLLELAPFAEIFSQIAPLEAVSIRETCLELIKQERVDLDRYSIDLDGSQAVHELRKDLLRALGQPAAVLPYRPCAVLASACFTRANLVHYLGLFHELQACFEHKPWMELQLAAAGVRVVPWSYFADEDLVLIEEAAASGPLVLRTNRSDGGAGLTLIEHPAQLARSWPSHPEGFLAAAPFLAPNVPLNVNACVFPDGQVSLHPASLQLIGLASCTNRRFGYCGNDFAKAAELDRGVLDQLEEATVAAGRWLGRQGYLGAFGVDAILYQDQVYLVEVNPRFQGSSALAARLARELDRPDLFLDHIAAFLDLPRPAPMPLHEMTRRQSALAHVVCHHLGSQPLHCAPVDPDHLAVRCGLLPRPEVAVGSEAILFDALFRGKVTETGGELLPQAKEQVLDVTRQLYGSAIADDDPPRSLSSAGQSNREAP
ncbi:MAG TPA: ATP-grasp domain-containing protein [Thermoanaerobaculia bacterium]|nr:ATP-grasp domain-containing protein [Thermoanaerobaculia bacterium]